MNWCEKRKAWITHKKFKKNYPFDGWFTQPYKNQKMNPTWQNKKS